MATQPTQYKSYISGTPGSPYFTGGQFPNLPQGGGFREVSQEQANQLLQQHLALRKTSGITQSDYERESQQFLEAFKPKSAYESYTNPFTGEIMRNVSQQTVDEIQQQQQGLQQGTLTQIRPGMFVPTGSAGANLAQQIQAGTAPQQPTGIQQGGQNAPSGTTSPTGTIQPTTPAGQQGTQPPYTGVSIVDYLKSVGQDSSFANRQQLAQSLGIQNYTGSAEQNTNLLNQLKGQQQTTAGQQQPITYAVKSGDTLSAIARANGVSIDDITGYRSNDPNLIFPGEILSIHKFQPEPTTEPSINTNIQGTETTIPTEVPLTETEKGYANFIQNQSFDSIYEKIKTDLNINSIKTQITDANNALLAIQDKKAEEMADINANPWISEELRLRKLKGLDNKYEQKIANQQNFLAQQQKIYDNGIQQAQWTAKLMIDQLNNDRQFYYKVKQDAINLSQQAETTGLKEQLLQAQIGATKALETQRLGKTGILTSIPTSIDITDPGQIEDILKDIKLTTGQKGDIADMLIVQRQISDLNNLAQKYGGFIGAGPGGTVSQFLASVTGKTREGAQDIRNSIGQIKGFIAKLRGGTSFTPNEQRLLDTYTPTINDSDPIIRSKLNSLSKYVNDKIETTIIVAGGILNKSLSANQPSDPLGLFK